MGCAVDMAYLNQCAYKYDSSTSATTEHGGLKRKRQMKGLIFVVDFLPRHVPRLPKWKLRLWLSPHRSDSTRYNYLRFHLTLNRLTVTFSLINC